MRPGIHRVGLAWFLGGVVASACGPSFEARSTVERPHDYARDRTYALRGETFELEGVDARTRDRIVPRVRAQIVSNLSAKGFTRVEDPERAALIVDFTIQGRVTTVAPGSVAGRPYGGGQMVDGALTITVSDRATNQRLWSGQLNEEWIAGGDRVPEVVAAVLRDFPPPRTAAEPEPTGAHASR